MASSSLRVGIVAIARTSWPRGTLWWAYSSPSLRSTAYNALKLVPSDLNHLARGFSSSQQEEDNALLDDIAHFLSLDECVRLDVRTEAEFAGGSIPGAINIPVQDLLSRLGEVPTGKPISVFCAAGVRSKMAQAILYKNGFTDVEDAISVDVARLALSRLASSE
mmetsp:Transcript_55076/g.101962  ORF Transcript_55076/g.101962 Transcript_55076/m.101962 type:complete len:164 (-) Transcript_55076:43-534(-)